MDLPTQKNPGGFWPSWGDFGHPGGGILATWRDFGPPKRCPARGAGGRREQHPHPSWWRQGNPCRHKWDRDTSPVLAPAGLHLPHASARREAGWGVPGGLRTSEREKPPPGPPFVPCWEQGAGARAGCSAPPARHHCTWSHVRATWACPSQMVQPARPQNGPFSPQAGPCLPASEPAVPRASVPQLWVSKGTPGTHQP